MRKFWVVYATDGYICGEPQAIFETKKEAEVFAKENVLSGIKEIELKRVNCKPIDCYY